MEPVKQPNGKYSYNFMYNGVRYRKQGIATKKEAQALIRKIINDVAHGVDVNSNTLFADYFEQWYTINKENVVSDKSFRRFESTRDKILEHFPPETRLKDLTRSSYQEFINKYAENLTKNSIQKMHNPLNACLEDAVYHGLIQKNPAWRATIYGKVPPKKEEDKYMEIDQYLSFKHFLMSKTSKSALLLFILHVTGGRFSEVNTLRQTDIIIPKNKIHLNGTKTENADRTVSIDPSEMKHIMTVLKSFDLKANQPIFDISHKAAEKTFNLGKEQIGIPKEKTMYALRHTHCSYLIANNISIYYISKRLGHANIKITLEYYSHLLQDHFEEDDINTRNVMELTTHNQ